MTESKLFNNEFDINVYNNIIEEENVLDALFSIIKDRLEMNNCLLDENGNLVIHDGVIKVLSNIYVLFITFA
jgi:hypothetical protein